MRASSSGKGDYGVIGPTGVADGRMGRTELYAAPEAARGYKLPTRKTALTFPVKAARRPHWEVNSRSVLHRVPVRRGRRLAPSARQDGLFRIGAGADVGGEFGEGGGALLLQAAAKAPRLFQGRCLATRARARLPPAQVAFETASPSSRCAIAGAVMRCRSSKRDCASLARIPAASDRPCRGRAGRSSGNHRCQSVERPVRN
jgi:hypothetical protein